MNVSPRQLGHGALEQQLGRSLAEGYFPIHDLIIEVTESVAADADAAGELRSVSALGARIAIDDFGTGYSTLSALCALPINLLKIDRDLIAGPSRRHRALGRSAVHLAAALGVPALAEGIESDELLDAAVSAGFSMGQGYGLGRPVAFDRSIRPERHLTTGGLLDGDER